MEEMTYSTLDVRRSKKGYAFWGVWNGMELRERDGKGRVKER